MMKTISPYDSEAMQALTPAARVRICHEYSKQPFAVEYAYPSSDIARFYGMSASGCWYVSGFVSVTVPRIKVSSHGYKTRIEAQAVCDVYANAGIN